MTVRNEAGNLPRLLESVMAQTVQPADIVIAISASGNSPNILAAARMAQQSGAITLALTGQDGGKLSRLADFTIYVPSQTIEQVEDAHLIIAHSLCVVLRKQLHSGNIIIRVEADRSVNLSKIGA